MLGLIARFARPAFRSGHLLRTPAGFRPFISRCYPLKPPGNNTPRRLYFRKRDPRDPRDPPSREDDGPIIPHYSHLAPNSPEYHAARIRAAKPLVADDFEFNSLLGGRRSSKYFFAFCALAAVGFFYNNLEQVPVTGRWRFNYLGDMRSSALSSVFRSAMVEAQREGMVLPEHHPRTIQVRRVLEKLIPVSGLEGYDWEVYVVRDDRPNAGVLPGGKVLVHTGLFKHITGNDDDLAIVLGHEIAHCIARHHGERASNALGPELMLITASIWAGRTVYQRLRSRRMGKYQGSPRSRSAALAGVGLIFMGANLTYVVGSMLTSYLLSLPMSRDQETEADYIGLMVTAEACFNPQAALRVWPRFEAFERRYEGNVPGARPIPERWRTHPTTVNRNEKFREWMPKAMEKYHDSDCHGTSRFADQFVVALRAPWLIAGRGDFP